MRRYRFWLLILLLAFGLRMVHVQARALWYDEAFAVLYASLSPERIVYGTVTPVEGAGAADVHPLFYYFLLHGWLGVVGRSPLAVRFLSVIFGMVTVALLWRLAAWCFDRRTGLAVGLLAAVNPFHIAYSQEARMYALLGLAAVTTTWFLLRALGAGARRRWWLLYAVAAACTLYAHNLGAFVLLALHLLVVVGFVTQRRPWRRRLLALVLADLGALLLFAPWLVGVLPGQLGFVGRGYWLARPGAREIIHAFMLPVFTFYEPVPFWLLGVELFTGVVALVLLILRGVRMRSRVSWFLLLCWTPIVSLMAISFWRPVYLERALLPSVLFYLVALGWLLVRGGLPAAVRLGLVGLLVLSTVGSLGVHYTYNRFPRPPFDRLTNFLRAEAGPDEVIVHDNKLTFFPAHYYVPALPQSFCPDIPGSGSDTLALPTQEALGLFAEPIDQAVTGKAAGVWYVVFGQMWAEYQALGYDDIPNWAWLRAHCQQDGDAYTIADLEVYHFVSCEVRP